MNRAIVIAAIVVMFVTACAKLPFLRKPASTPVLPTGTSVSSPLLSATDTPAPEPSATPSAASEPTAIPTPTPTLDLAGCKLAAAYVRDVTIPDNTIVAVRNRLVKTWEIKNTGTCTWTAQFSLTYVKGQMMSQAKSVPLTVTAPGQTALVSIELTAPDKPGSYRSDWQLCAGDQCFGPIFYVQLVTQEPTPTPAEQPKQ